MKRTYQPKKDKEVRYMDSEKEWQVPQEERFWRLEEIKEEKLLVHNLL